MLPLCHCGPRVCLIKEAKNYKTHIRIRINLFYSLLRHLLGNHTMPWKKSALSKCSGFHIYIYIYQGQFSCFTGQVVFMQILA